MDIQQFEGRKREHIRHALDPAHQAQGLSGLHSVHLYHDALPDLDFEEISIESLCLGSPSPTPFYIAGMTAGHADAASLNEIFARACVQQGWGLGVGSLRRDLVALTESSKFQVPHSQLSNKLIDPWEKLRENFPDLKLFANLGITQIFSVPIEIIEKLVHVFRAQALVIHTNALQEVLQPEGTPRFKGALNALRSLCETLRTPVILKETGCGFSPLTLKRFKEIPLAAIDVSGLGGTHWGRIEGARARSLDLEGIRAQAAQTFSNWGEPTVDSVLAVRNHLPGLEVWASGGVRTGLDAAKLIALGAHQVGFAQPALQAALQGYETLIQWMKQQEFELKTALFCTGSASPKALRQKEGVWKKGEV